MIADGFEIAAMTATGRGLETGRVKSIPLCHFSPPEAHVILPKRHVLRITSVGSLELLKKLLSGRYPSLEGFSRTDNLLYTFYATTRNIVCFYISVVVLVDNIVFGKSLPLRSIKVHLVSAAPSSPQNKRNAVFLSTQKERNAVSH